MAAFKGWHKLTTEHELHENSCIQWLQVTSAIPEGSKKNMKIQLTLLLMTIIQPKAQDF